MAPLWPIIRTDRPHISDYYRVTKVRHEIHDSVRCGS